MTTPAPAGATVAAPPPPARVEELRRALDELEQRLEAACAAAGRTRAEVTLVAVSKTWPASDVVALAGLGVADFGENRDADAAGKATALAGRGLRWHFVGQVQTRKARSVASYADVVHSLDRPALAAALSAGAQRAGRGLDVLVQVRLDDGPGRGGAAPDQVAALAATAAALPHLRLAGVMAVAPRDGDPAAAFQLLAAVAQDLRRAHPQARVVSAGMSGDLEAAVAAGATHVRVGTSLFGRRPPVLR